MCQFGFSGNNLISNKRTGALSDPVNWDSGTDKHLPPCYVVTQVNSA